MRTVLRLLVVVAALLVTVRASQADITISKGGTWHLLTRVRVSACALGRCSGNRAVDERDVDLPEGAIIRIALQVFSCGAVALPDQCDLVPARKGKMKLRRCDRRTVQEILRDCSPYAKLRLTRIGGFEKPAPDGMSFVWKAVAAFTVRVSGQLVSVVATVKVNGESIGAGLRSAVATDVPAAVVPVLPDRVIEAAIAEALHR
jgi:hypothetical protein